MKETHILVLAEEHTNEILSSHNSIRNTFHNLFRVFKSKNVEETRAPNNFVGSIDSHRHHSRFDVHRFLPFNYQTKDMSFHFECLLCVFGKLIRKVGRQNKVKLEKMEKKRTNSNMFRMFCALFNGFDDDDDNIKYDQRVWQRQMKIALMFSGSIFG